MTIHRRTDFNQNSNKNIPKNYLVYFFKIRPKHKGRFTFPFYSCQATVFKMATETLDLLEILGADFGAKTCSLFGKALAGIASHGQVLFSRIWKTIMSFQSREMSNTSLFGNAQGGPEVPLTHNQWNKRKVRKISKVWSLQQGLLNSARLWPSW